MQCTTTPNAKGAPMEATTLDTLTGRASDRQPAAEDDLARSGEWDARGLGPLGRRLLPEIDTYLAFFAIARGY
jgi:hypothetical protein